MESNIPEPEELNEDVEGHRKRNLVGDDEDVEGHRAKSGRDAARDDGDDDVEGHRVKAGN